MVIFTGVYGAKLMKEWEKFEDGELLLSPCVLFPLLLLISFSVSVSVSASFMALQQRLFLMRVIG
jgi:hypothetical protein